MANKNEIEVNHTLYLYAPGVDKYHVQAPFLAMLKDGERAIYVTHEKDIDMMLGKFGELGIEITIIDPEKLKKLNGSSKRKLRILVDGATFTHEHLYYEKILDKLSEKHFVMCTYPVTKIHPNLLKELVAGHEKLIFSSQDTTLLSSDTLNKSGLSEESIERFVKNNIEMVVLSLVFKEPMCGLDIIKKIHKNFNVLISPGTMYPLLHTLMKKGLVKCEVGIKSKVYKVPEDAKPKINNLLGNQVQTSICLGKLLKIGD